MNSLYGSFSQLELSGSRNNLHSIMEEGFPAAPVGAPEALPRPNLPPVRTSWADLSAAAAVSSGTTEPMTTGAGDVNVPTVVDNDGTAAPALGLAGAEAGPRSLVLTSDEGLPLPRDALRSAAEVYGEVASLALLDRAGGRVLLSFFDSRAAVLAEHMLDGAELCPGCALRVQRPSPAELAAAEPAALRAAAVLAAPADDAWPLDAARAAAALGAYGDVVGISPDAAPGGVMRVDFYDARAATAALAGVPAKHGHWLAVWKPDVGAGATGAASGTAPPAAPTEPVPLPSAGSSGALASGVLLGQLSSARPSSMASSSSKSLDGSVHASAPAPGLGRPPLGPHHHHAMPVPTPGSSAMHQSVEDQIAAVLGVGTRGGSPPRGAPPARLPSSVFGSSAALLASAGAEGSGQGAGGFGNLPFSASEPLLDALLAGTSQQQQQQAAVGAAAFGGSTVADLGLLRSLGDLGLGMPAGTAAQPPAPAQPVLSQGGGSNANLAALGTNGLDFEALAAELQGIGAGAGGPGAGPGANGAPRGPTGANDLAFGSAGAASASTFEGSLAGLPAPLPGGFLGLPSVPSAPSLASLAKPDLLGYANTAGLTAAARGGGAGTGAPLLGTGGGTLRPSASTGSLWGPAAGVDASAAASAARWGEPAANDLSAALVAQQAQIVQQAQLLQAAQQAALASGAAMQVLQQALLGQGALGTGTGGAPGGALADALAAAGLSPAAMGLGGVVGGALPGGNQQQGGLGTSAGSSRPSSQQHQVVYMQSGRGGSGGPGHHGHAQHHSGARAVTRSRSEAALGGRLARRPLDPSAEAERRSQQERLYALDPDRARLGEDRRTTLMIRNIPNKYTQKMLLSLIEEKFRGEYDFFYLPIDFKNKCNVGYAFINMISLQSIPRLWEEFHGKRWPKFNSEKICCINYGRIQGKAALVQHFQNSSLLHEDKRCQPVLFHTEGDRAGEPESFPTEN